MSKLTKEQKVFINTSLFEYFRSNKNAEHEAIKKNLFAYVSELIQKAKAKSMAELSYQEVLDGLASNGLAIQVKECADRGWKHIKDAPKDGTPIFVFCREVGRDLAKYDTQKKKWIRTWDHSVIRKPTLWTDAPDEPQESK